MQTIKQDKPDQLTVVKAPGVPEPEKRPDAVGISKLPPDLARASEQSWAQLEEAYRYLGR